MQRRLYRLKELASRPGYAGVVGMAPSTIWARIKDGRFPSPVRLGTRSVAWRSEDIERWLSNPEGWQASKK